MIDRATEYLTGLSSSIPLAPFAFVSSFVEELVAPIPSPIVGTLIGTLASTDGYGLAVALLWLGFLATFGKTLACIIIYIIVSRISGATVERWGRYLGIGPRDIERASRYFAGSLRDHAVLILIRAIPFIPSLPVSIAAGVLRTPLRFYVIATFVGNWLRSMLFIFVGYAGVAAYAAYLEGAGDIETMLTIGTGALAVLFLAGVYVVRMRKKRS